MAEAPVGLTTDEARRRLAKDGPNAIVDVAQHPVLGAAQKLWAPVPWMLEAAILLQLMLGDYVEAGVVALLLIFNGSSSSLMPSAVSLASARWDPAAGGRRGDPDGLLPPWVHIRPHPGERAPRPSYAWSPRTISPSCVCPDVRGSSSHLLLLL
jgi:Cation transporter/ATPase, N-terminus